MDVRRCDHCKAERLRDDTSEWYRIASAGIRTHLCSTLCLEAWATAEANTYRERRAAFEGAPWPPEA